METNKKQLTTVEWMEIAFLRCVSFQSEDDRIGYFDILKKAKQMEREQIQDAYLECNCRMSGIEVGTIEDINEAKEYYEENYGK